MSPRAHHPFDRYSVLVVVLPLMVLMAAAALYSAAEGATVCLDFKGTCTATETSDASVLRAISLVLAMASLCVLFLGCRRIGGGLHLDLMSDTPVVERSVSIATVALVLIAGVLILGLSLALAPRTAGLVIISLGSFVAFWQLPFPASTRAFYGGVVLFLASTVLFGGPFVAVGFIVIACFVLATTALLSTASRGF